VIRALRGWEHRSREIMHRLTLTGPMTLSSPVAIAAGPDDNPWLTENRLKLINTKKKRGPG
jgi:hypothetical protein